jgi:hypothetical protein
VLRLLADRRDELSRARTQTLNRLHRLLAELVPAGARRHLTAHPWHTVPPQNRTVSPVDQFPREGLVSRAVNSLKKSAE